MDGSWKKKIAMLGAGLTMAAGAKIGFDQSPSDKQKSTGKDRGAEVVKTYKEQGLLEDDKVGVEARKRNEELRKNEEAKEQEGKLIETFRAMTDAHSVEEDDDDDESEEFDGGVQESQDDSEAADQEGDSDTDEVEELETLKHKERRLSFQDATKKLNEFFGDKIEVKNQFNIFLELRSKETGVMLARLSYVPKAMGGKDEQTFLIWRRGFDYSPILNEEGYWPVMKQQIEDLLSSKDINNGPSIE